MLYLKIRAILDLKTQRDKLHQYQRRITVLTDRETDIAKQMLAQGDKKRALIALPQMRDIMSAVLPHPRVPRIRACLPVPHRSRLLLALYAYV